ncbi:MAG: hemerythrin domain-containing protein [Acidobacteriota bacterium]|nr:hemerythrin domain-containing protein [Acidobacteriota bacterium]
MSQDDCVAGDPGGGVGAWRDRSLHELIAHIVATHHAGLRAALHELQAAAAPPARPGLAGDARWRRTGARLLQQFRTETENHLRKEEAVLFPLIEQLERSAHAGQPAPRHPFGTLGTLITVMEQDHELTRRQLQQLAALLHEPLGVDDEIRQATRRVLADIEQDMVLHTQLEDDVLFPRTVGLESS